MRGITAPRANRVWARTDTWAEIPASVAAKMKPKDLASFASRSEFNRWHQLLLLQKAGKIRNLERQVKLPIIIEGELMWTLRPDFTFFEGPVRVHEDHKGRRKGAEYRQFKDRWRVSRAILRNAEWRVNGVVWDGK